MWFCLFNPPTALLSTAASDSDRLALLLTHTKITNLIFTQVLSWDPCTRSRIASQEQRGFLWRGDASFTHLGGARDGNRAKRNWRHGGEHWEKKRQWKKKQNKKRKWQTWIRLTCSFCCCRSAVYNPAEPPNPHPPHCPTATAPQPFLHGLQQLLHIFDFTAIVAAATTPCCIVLYTAVI